MKLRAVNNLLDCQRNLILFSEASCGGGARVSWWEEGRSSGSSCP